jgi:hypothetical protein
MSSLPVWTRFGTILERLDGSVNVATGVVDHYGERHHPIRYFGRAPHVTLLQWHGMKGERLPASDSQSRCTSATGQRLASLADHPTGTHLQAILPAVRPEAP